MKLYIITTETFPYGLAATQRIRCYAKCIAATGYVCEVLCINRCEDPSKPLGNAKAYGIMDGYEYRYVGGSTYIGKAWKNSFFRVSDTLRLLLMMLFSFNKNDIAIVYSYSPILLSLVKTFSSIKGFKSYFELNEHPSVLQGLFGVTGESERDKKKIRSKLSGFDGVLCISCVLKDFLIKCGIQEDKVHVVNMSVDSSRFDGLVKQNKEPYIGYCGAADNNKDGVDNLIKAFAKISTKHSGLKLYVMGPKRSDCENERLSMSLGVADRVVFTGIVSAEQMPQMLINAQVLALARPQSIQARYGFPTKLGEYLLTGNPVVVTGVGDIPRFLKDGESAYLAEPDNLEEFAQRLDKALSDDDAKRIGQRGRIVAETWFSNEKVRSQLREALKI